MFFWFSYLDAVWTAALTEARLVKMDKSPQDRATVIVMR